MEIVFDELGALDGGTPVLLSLFAVFGVDVMDLSGELGQLFDVVLENVVVIGIG
jgi:hypothetical protein